MSVSPLGMKQCDDNILHMAALPGIFGLSGSSDVQCEVRDHHIIARGIVASDIPNLHMKR